MILALRRAIASYVRRRSSSWRWAVAVGWALLIWMLSSRAPGGGTPGILVVLLYNGAHVFLFGILGSLVHLAGPGREPASSVRAVALAGGWGAVDEIHQHFVPGRHSSLWDVATDVAGAVLFVAVVAALRGESAGWARIAIPLSGMAAAITVAGATFA